jgi:hypothetical protein
MRTSRYGGKPSMLKEAGRPARPVGELLARLSRGPLVSKLAMLVVLAGVIRIALRPADVQHDVAMYLQAGQLLLRGQKPYVDFIDLNPPLITYASAIPAFVARVLGTALAPTAMLMTACAAAVSLVITRRVLASVFEEAGADPLFADVTVLALAYAFFLIDVPERIDLPFPGNPAPDPRLSAFFAQREHLFMIGAAPFLALRFRRWEGGRNDVLWAAVAGAVASVVTCLKPQFVVVLLAFEVGCLASKRKPSPLWAPEVAAFCAMVVAYVAHFAFLSETVRSAWFGRWLPFVIEGYGVFNDPSYGHLIARCWPALGAFVAAFGVTLVGDPLGRRLTRSFALMALGGALLYVVQRKGWTYHAYPFRTCSIVVLLCCVAGARALGASDDGGGVRFLLPISRQRLGQALGALVGLTGFACVISLALIDTPKDVERLRRRSQIMRTIASFTEEGDPVLVATASVWDPYPALLLLNRVPGSRYMWLFPIPMLQAVHSDKGDPEHDFVRDLADDIRERRPKLVLLQTGKCFGCKKTSVDAFFREHPPLAAALEDYSLRGTVRDGQELQVLVRVASAR